MITLFFTGRKLIVLDALPKGRKYNQLYFVQNIFPESKEENRICRRRNSELTFWVPMDNSMCHNGSKVESKFGKHGLLRIPHPSYSPDISLCDFWLFGLLKGILMDHEFTSSDEIEEAITTTWNDLTLDDMQSVYRNWLRGRAWIIENAGEFVHE
jgi:hypothetical protein